MTEPWDSTDDALYTAYCWVGVAFGAAMTLTARPFLRAYNFPDHSPQSLHLLRLAGTPHRHPRGRRSAHHHTRGAWSSSHRGPGLAQR